MYKKETAVQPAVGEINFSPILSSNFNSCQPSEQDFYGSARLLVASRDAYLTNTDNSPSTPEKNRPDFKEKSLFLYASSIKLFNDDKSKLILLHANGFQKFKYINDDNIVLYVSFNNNGNSNAGWELAKENSNTDKARLSSKQRAFEKALANVDVWDYFATFTLDRKKQDRHDLSKSLSHLTKFLRRRHVLYFIVPERHRDGAWHFHALLSGSIRPYLADFEGKALKNRYISMSLAQGKLVQHCKAYSEVFGYNTIEPCRNKEACTYYMTKYVLKTFDDPNFERASRRRFFCSTGLKSPVIVMPFEVDLNDFEPVCFSSHTEKVYLHRYTMPNIVTTPSFSLKQESG